MADGLVQLERDLLAVEDHGRRAGRAGRRRQERERVVRHARRVPRQVQRQEVLEARLPHAGAVRAGVGADLGLAIADRDGLEAAPALEPALVAEGALWVPWRTSASSVFIR